MDKTGRIARRIVSSRATTVRGLLGMDVSVFVEDEQKTWRCVFDGPKSLTPDGIARWSVWGVLDLPVMITGDVAVVSGIDTDGMEKAVCSLFNTLAGSVNDDTYEKYVEE